LNLWQAATRLKRTTYKSDSPCTLIPIGGSAVDAAVNRRQPARDGRGFGPITARQDRAAQRTKVPTCTYLTQCVVASWRPGHACFWPSFLFFAQKSNPLATSGSSHNSFTFCRLWLSLRHRKPGPALKSILSVRRRGLWLLLAGSWA
jgi:hypothetical protein